MRPVWTVLALIGITTAAYADGNTLAGKPAFDPRTLRGTQQGPLTQVLTLGSAHLSQLQNKPSEAQLAPLLDKLAAFKPDIITHEGLSGEQCDQVERYKTRYPGIFDDYCLSTAEVAKSTGLTVPQAMEAIEATLGKWPRSPEAAERRRLAMLFLAANDRPSALVQWLRLPPAERRLGDGIDQPLLAMLEKAASRTNETVSIGVALAVRLGHERMYAVDDHTSDSIQALGGDGFGPAIQAHWSSGADKAFPAVQRYKQATAELGKTGDYLGYFRMLNQPQTQRAFIALDFGGALKLKGAELYGRQYVAWYETRNLRMVANVRAAFGNHPGARVLNIVGASHKGYYDAYLDMMSDVQIVEADKVLR